MRGHSGRSPGTWAKPCCHRRESCARWIANATPAWCAEGRPVGRARHCAVPSNWEEHAAIGRIGKTHYEFRAALMASNQEGLTKTYNRFHDPHEGAPAVRRLRDLHAEMDRAVLDAYGWSDILAQCEFLLDHEIDEEEWGDRKRPCRYRWPDDVRDEVLSRLLELNAQRAEAERLSDESSLKKANPKRAPVSGSHAAGPLLEPCSLFKAMPTGAWTESMHGAAQRSGTVEPAVSMNRNENL